MTFEEASLLTSSEKVTLVTMQAEKIAKIFTLHSGSIYKRQVEHFVESVKSEGVALTSVSSIASITNNSFFYDIINKTLYLQCSGGANPKLSGVSLVYKFFLSNKPVILPCDLASGEAVEWLPYVLSVGSIGQQLDDENTGIVLESSSSIDLINNEGFFDEIFDTLIWENKSVEFFSWFAGTPSTEARRIFQGVVDSKDFGLDKVSFKVKDFVFKLRDKVSLGVFTATDGKLPDSILNTPKRRIYGQVKQAKAVCLDNVLNGYDLSGLVSITTQGFNLTGTASGTFVSNDLTGTMAGTLGTRTITGTGSSFTTQISPNQKIKLTNGTATYTFTVLSVASNTSLAVTSNIGVTFTGFTGKNTSVGSNKVYGVGTSFLQEVQQGSSLNFFSGATNYSYSVESIQSSTELTLEDYLTASFTDFSIKNNDIKNNVITGVGTNFLKELSPGDEMLITWLGIDYKLGIESVASDTVAVSNKSLDFPVTSVSAINKPSNPYRHLNRVYHVAGHKLREPTTTITNVNANNRFIIGSTDDLFAGDQILVGSSFATIRRISGNEVVTNSAISPVPSVGTTVKKLPIQNVYLGNRELVYSRDWGYANSTEAKITLDPLAEFNITQEKLLGVNLTFTNGSSTVSTTSTADFRSILKPRDWIRKNSIVSGENTWHEILDVNEQSILLRSNYSGTTATTSALIKVMDYASDDSILTCNCLGFESSGLWLKTPSDMVRHLVLNDAGFSAVDEASFTKAKADCDYIVSMVIPETIGSDAPAIRDVITKINESVFGSLYGNSSLLISYAILNSEKPNLDSIIKDDDIISFDTQSKTEIYNNIKASYRPFVDLQNGTDTFEVVTYNSGFVDKHIGLKNTLEKTLYLYESDNAIIIAQRLALFYSMASTKVTLKGKANFFLNAVNDKLFLSFDRLFKRFGGNDKRKIGIITGIKKGQTETEVQISDLGNIFNRVPSIAPDTVADYSTSSMDDRARYGYVVDNDTFTPDVSNEDGLSCNLIG